MHRHPARFCYSVLPALWGAFLVITTLTLDTPAASAQEPLVILNPDEPLSAHWRPHSFGEPDTTYTPTTRNGTTWIRAEAEAGTASGWIRDIQWQADEYPWLAWRWYVERLQPSADIRTKTHDDFAGVVYVLFGTPKPLRRQPPTIAYTWSNDNVAVGDIVRSPRPFSRLRFLVLRNQRTPDGQPVLEVRNLRDDYERIFGMPLKTQVAHIAIWTDSDQTAEPAITYYGAIRAFSDLQQVNSER